MNVKCLHCTQHVVGVNKLSLYPPSTIGAFLITRLVKKSACSAGDQGSIPGSGISLGEGNGNPFQYSGLENPMDRGA